MLRPFSLANWILKHPTLARFLNPIAKMYANLSGYKKFGLRYDDLLMEENDEMEKALKRLNKKEAYDRIYRLRRAVQCDITSSILPKSEWTKDSEDVPYVSPLLDEVLREKKEREAFDALYVRKPGGNIM
ncbi:ubiquinol-cytochrome-c reductase complex subunit 6 [Schizosaccharomyces japonicus yFS275]|uniref:Cytochrome b-c1 complex subunit 7 n=1 Tax=Schizosaccharomyces japonicus (strain yFS275 / FY16936) TaxID=402676 RepID=B6K4D4_SCHJY|nr:ubiquinol-cytochrome-c reductase complex subunit 6 [Schizosaccharomyces japonicus yFS275]EEB08341.1 ubiquinol-cytochrome-c reductase complex subunit 6 [Schizosaccharomyces japonicus yFS275]